MIYPSVTIAVSVYNEENNIKQFIESVLKQNEKGFKLELFLILSDGSTDKTNRIIRSIKSPKIKLVDFKQRLGKSTRLNQTYSLLNSDILVQSDSDVVFSNPDVLNYLIKPLIKYRQVGMTGGNPQPLAGKTFIEKSINVTVFAYQNFRKKVRKSNNIFSADGRLLAFKKRVVKKIKVPENMIANDAYTYFCNIKLGYQYKFVKNAVVYYRSPQFLQDHIKQNIRFLSARKRMTRYFPKEIIKKEYEIPFFLFVKELFNCLINYPVESIYIFLINRYCHIKAHFEEKQLTATWQIARSTKKLFNP